MAPFPTDALLLAIGVVILAIIIIITAVALWHLREHYPQHIRADLLQAEHCVLRHPAPGLVRLHRQQHPVHSLRQDGGIEHPALKY